MSARPTRSGRPARGRGRAGKSRPVSPPPAVESDDLDLEVEARPRTGAKRTVLNTVAQLPNYFRLLGGLLLDRRVAGIDKLLVIGAFAYILSPIDVLPDFIPFFGQVDDVFLLMTAITRLIGNAGRRVLLDHWRGDPAELHSMNIRSVLAAAAFFLPRSIRRRLRRRF